MLSDPGDPAGRLGSDLGTGPILVPADGLMSQKLRVWGSHGEVDPGRGRRASPRRGPAVYPEPPSTAVLILTLRQDAGQPATCR